MLLSTLFGNANDGVYYASVQVWFLFKKPTYQLQRKF